MERNFNMITSAASSLEDYLDRYEKSKEPIREKGEVIDETFSESQKLLNRDILPELLKSKQFVDVIYPYMDFALKFNLYELGWRMQFGKSKQWAGLCSAEEHKQIKAAKSKNRNIYLSIDFTKHDANWKQNFKDVMLHEMAHAVIFEIFYFTDNIAKKIAFNENDPYHKATKGHGKFWEIVCGALTGKEGCERFYKNASLEEQFKTYRYVCLNCENKKYSNSPNFASRCSVCGKAVIIEKNNE